jgi:hypothetical protein
MAASDTQRRQPEKIDDPCGLAPRPFSDSPGVDFENTVLRNSSNMKTRVLQSGDYCLKAIAASSGMPTSAEYSSA